MPRLGRPPKPVEVKRRTGNPGHRPLPQSGITALAPVSRIAASAAPDSGAALVQAILDAGASAWVGETDRLGLVALLAETWDERRTLRAALSDTPADDPTAILLGHRARRDLRDLEKQIITCLSLLGLTPVDRGRLGVAEVRARSALEEMMARRPRA